MSIEAPKPPSRNTRLQGDELVVTARMTAQVTWAVSRYVSLIYCQRLYDLYKGWVGAVEEWTGSLAPKDLTFERETLRMLYAAQGRLESGLKDVSYGRRRTGYEELNLGCDIFRYMLSRRFDGFSWTDLGESPSYDQPSAGAFTWLERASAMGLRLKRTLSAGWTYENLLGIGAYQNLAERRFPAVLEPAPGPDMRRALRTGDRVPFSGIWLPTSFPGGCPNYLVEGWPAPEATRTHLRRDTPSFQACDGSWTEPTTEYFDERVAAKWHPMWRDDRYKPGAPPDPPEYMNEDTAFPAYPPHYTPPQ